MKNEQLEKEWAELDKVVQARTVYLTLTCTPYDMDDEYQELLEKERVLKKKMEESNG